MAVLKPPKCLPIPFARYYSQHFDPFPAMPDIFMKKEIGETKDVLQDIVVVVSLVSTLAKSFGSAGHLYRKLKKKAKNTKKGLKEDIKQELEDHSSDHGHADPQDARSEGGKHHHHWRSRSRSRHKRDESCDSGKDSIERSYDLIRAEYNRGYEMIGEKYAVGDLITRNHLQAQIIVMQQQLLYTYEDIILNPEFPRHPPSYHVKELVHTTRAARSAVIEALAQQYHRMLPAPERKDSARLVPGSFPASPTVHESHDVVLHKHKTERVKEHGSASRSPTRDAKLAPTGLYCLYARNLQRNSSLPLTDTFKPGGSGCCPYCQAHISSQPNKAWEMVKEDESHKGLDRTFLVGTRFLVKCHRLGEGYACVLCSQCRDADTVCGEIRALVEHLWKEHGCAELEMDDDIGEER